MSRRMEGFLGYATITRIKHGGWSIRDHNLAKKEPKPMTQGELGEIIKHLAEDSVIEIHYHKPSLSTAAKALLPGQHKSRLAALSASALDLLDLPDWGEINAHLAEVILNKIDELCAAGGTYAALGAMGPKWAKLIAERLGHSRI